MAVRDDYQDYKNELNDLKVNKKPLINFLTLLAEEKISNASQIVRAIEERILETKPEYILPVLYVLDSIVKNLRSTIYIQLFENKLPVIFASAFNKVDERTRSAMFKLRQTWTPFFSNLSLYNLDTRAHYIDPAWPITAKIPDPLPSTPNIHVNPNFIHQNPTSSTVSSIDQQLLLSKQENNDRIVNQTLVKISESSSRDAAYHMIPIDRLEQSRQEVEKVLDKDIDDEQQTNKKSFNEKKEKERNTATELPDTNNQATIDDKPKEVPIVDNTENDVEGLFGGTDIDYRDTDVVTQQKPTNITNLDSDRLVDLNSKCLSLAEEKFKSKELSSEEYQATLKLLQNILQNEVHRLTVPSTTTSSLINGTNHSIATAPANSVSAITNTTSSNPFQQQLFPFSQQHPTTTTALQQPSLNTFPFPGFANDAHRHAMQILATVGAPSYYNVLPYIAPLPPAPALPSFTLAQNSFASQQLLQGRESPPKKRIHPESNPNNHHSDEDKKKRICRYESIPTEDKRSHNFDEENIAAVPSLIDANINTLKKKYIGVIQQLYIGKYQCRLCGLRFSAKQKHSYTHHLDWHYWENRQAATSAALLQRCRDWYSSIQEWTVHEENIDEQIKTNQMMLTKNRKTKDLDHKSLLLSEIISCPAKGDDGMDDDRCYVCHDPFENFFDDNREEWHLKDAMRVDGKIYHPICYQDVKYQVNDKGSISFINDSSTLNDVMMDGTSNLSSDSQTVDNAMATVNIKSENEDTIDDDSSSNDESSRPPPYFSSMSFVNLVETMFVKKEDFKPIETIKSETENVKEEVLNSATMGEEIPFLTIKRETECEFLIDKTSDGIGTSSD